MMANAESVLESREWGHLVRKAVGTAGKLLLVAVILGLWLWCIGAIWHSGSNGIVIRGAMTCVFALVFPIAWFQSKNRSAVAICFLIAAGATIGLWQLKRPSNERRWSSDMAVLPYGEFDRNLVQLRNIRNCTYETTEKFTVDYYDRTFDLKQLRTAYFIVEPIGKTFDGLAHTLVTFGFDDDQYVAISVEVRREQDEHFNPIAGMFKEYELMYVIGDERDLIRLRTDYRKDKVYFFPIVAPQETIRTLFVDMIERANRLRNQPEFYHTFFSSCTTNIVDHVNRIAPSQVPFSYKVLLPGYSGRLAYDLGLIDTDVSYEEVQRRCRIDQRAREIGDDPRFSILIREMK